MERRIGLALQAAVVILLALILLRPAPDYGPRLEAIEHTLLVMCERDATPAHADPYRLDQC